MNRSTIQNIILIGFTLYYMQVATMAYTSKHEHHLEFPSAHEHKEIKTRKSQPHVFILVHVLGKFVTNTDIKFISSIL